MGFFDNEPKKKMGCLVTSMNQTHSSRIYPITIPYNYTHDSQIWDWDASVNDGDGYRDGSVGDSDLWDD